MIEVNNNIVAHLINSIPVDISEYCFSNLFCFQEKHKFEYTSVHDLRFIKGTDSTVSYLMPLFIPNKHNIDNIVSAMKLHKSALYPIDESWINCFADPRFIINEYAKDFDYVFSREKLAKMAGNKLSKKRNLISQFTRNCEDIIVEPFSKNSVKDALAILDVWEKDSTDDKPITDYFACQLGINNYNDLNLTGILVYSKKAPIAFSLGEKIRTNYILHFAKANIRCKGVYQYLFQATAQYLDNVDWINFEQDLGRPALQKMKTSYYPDKIIKKYTITLTSAI